MALKLSLKPHERMIVGSAVIANGDSRCNLIIENNVPILREKDILSESEADSPCKRIYLTVQLMYVDEKNVVKYHETYWDLVKDVLKAAPSTIVLIDEMSNHILNGRYYNALKKAKELIEHEQEVISHVQKSVRNIP